jgi:hypothetical protein
MRRALRQVVADVPGSVEVELVTVAGEAFQRTMKLFNHLRGAVHPTMELVKQEVVSGVGVNEYNQVVG